MCLVKGEHIYLSGSCQWSSNILITEVEHHWFCLSYLIAANIVFIIKFTGSVHTITYICWWHHGAINTVLLLKLWLHQQMHNSTMYVFFLLAPTFCHMYIDWYTYSDMQPHSQSPSTRQTRNNIQGQNPVWIKNRCL